MTVKPDELRDQTGIDGLALQSANGPSERVCEPCQSAARAWMHLLLRQQDLGDWLLDQAMDASGSLAKAVIDACLGGDDFVPGSFRMRSNDREFQIELVSTEYSIVEVENRE